MTQEIISSNGEARAAEAGYLLVETLVASALLLVALLAIMPIYTLAMRQNAYAKDVTVASTLALDKAEEFSRWNCANIRRGTCCKEPNAGSGGASSLTAPTASCGADNIQVEGITYRRTCIIRQNSVTAAGYSQSATDDSTYGFPYAGLNWIQVTVTPGRNSQFQSKTVKPAITTFWKACP